MSGGAKLAIGAGVTAGVLIGIAYVQGHRFADLAAAGDLASAERAANISFLTRDITLALVIGLLVLSLVLTIRLDSGPVRTNVGPWPGYL